MEVSKLQHPPLDGISRLRYAPTPGSTHLLVSSWDSHLRLYDTSGGLLTGIHKCGGPILDCAFWQDANRALSVGLDRMVVGWDFLQQRDMRIGQHEEPIRCVEYHQTMQTIVTGSWDRTARVRDPRTGDSSVAVARLGAKVFAMDLAVDKLVVAASDRHVHIYDFRQLTAGPLERRESSLKHQMRSLQVSPDGHSFASSSVEGRVAIEYFDSAENQRSRYAFKCHRVKDAQGVEVVHPVNALAYHRTFGTFATGGSDGGVCTWDGQAKKRLWKLSPFDTSVSSLAFSADGQTLAIAASYTFDEGEKKPPPVTEIAIRHVADSEVQPKSRS